MWLCKHCAKEFEGFSTSEKANHSRWCNLNPKRRSYVEDLSKARLKARSSKTSFRNQYSYGAKCSDETRRKISESSKGRTHTVETKELLRQKALASNHRRILRSTRKYTQKDGTVVLLDSSWEEALAIRLDELNIKWIRPNSVKWTDDEGKGHNYFPDFYLVDHDLYLDPKNEQVYKTSTEKINKVLDILPNLKIIRTLEECKNFSI
jgi:hypothetical protein